MHKQGLMIVPKHSESPPLESKWTLRPKLMILPSKISILNNLSSKNTIEENKA